MTSRFAPSTTGRAHPGTCLAALLWWLDGRSRGERLVLRWENTDRQRCRPEYLAGLRDDFRWLGIDWDEEERQSDFVDQHRAAWQQLQASGLCYPCSCTRAQLASLPRGRDGAPNYDRRCRGKPAEISAQQPVAWRLALPDGPISWREDDEASYHIGVPEELSDPIIWRKDDSPAYHLASVIDDARQKVTRIVRGRDLRWATPAQLAIQQALFLPTPQYRHHPLLFECRPGDHRQPNKYAKSHGAIAVPELAQHYTAAAFCGVLAGAIGLQQGDQPVTPGDLLNDFQWAAVTEHDQVISWHAQRLHHVAAVP